MPYDEDMHIFFAVTHTELAQLSSGKLFQKLCRVTGHRRHDIEVIARLRD